MTTVSDLLSLPSDGSLDAYELEEVVLSVASALDPFVGAFACNTPWVIGAAGGLGPLLSADLILSGRDEGSDHSLVRVMVGGIIAALVRTCTPACRFRAEEAPNFEVRITNRVAAEILLAVVKQKLLPGMVPPRVVGVRHPAGDLLSFGPRADVDLATGKISFLGRTQLALLDCADAGSSMLSSLDDGTWVVDEASAAISPRRVHASLADALEDFGGTVERMVQSSASATLSGTSDEWAIGLSKDMDGTLRCVMVDATTHEATSGQEALSTFLEAARGRLSSLGLFVGTCSGPSAG